ncbi:hypothetical protein RchiOBHm_Chr1g0376431 [Rosa chinensis]|uniref:Uncharacterized protein n=1 Tax=Rosa chinensis TaxID=74649 RepID=A0A2P6SMU5_ROSCH|nr:hypothetical protein RchiOBHm_Chr1g0376431 [Rosa chinensis]
MVIRAESSSNPSQLLSKQHLEPIIEEELLNKHMDTIEEDM